MKREPKWRIAALRDIVKSPSRGTVLIDSCKTFDVGYETMVFKCDSGGNIESYLDIDRAIYPTFEDMKYGHQQMIGKWKNK